MPVVFSNLCNSKQFNNAYDQCQSELLKAIVIPFLEPLKEPARKAGELFWGTLFTNRPSVKKEPQKSCSAVASNPKQVVAGAVALALITVTALCYTHRSKLSEKIRGCTRTCRSYIPFATR